MPTVTDCSPKVKELKEVITEHTEALLRQMQAGKSENFICYLEFCARFHDYSFRNILLAYSQYPTMTRLAGMRAWNKLGRRIKKGEKGIAILAPVLAKIEGSEPGEEPVSRLIGFRVVYVFDKAQTEGDPLPDIIHAEGDPGDLIRRLESRLEDAGITVEWVDCIPDRPTALGASMGNRVVLRDDLPPANAFRTLVHEFAHEKLHRRKEEKEESKTVKETEADATAFVVCRHFGIECDSSDYLLLYDSTPEILLSRMERIRKAACEIIEAMEGELVEAGGTL